MNSFMADDQASVSVSRLLAFRAENVRSFRDGLELPMLATGLADEGLRNRIVVVALAVGHVAAEQND